MKHLNFLTRPAMLPAHADSLLVKRAQLEMLGQAVEIATAISILLKQEETS